MQRDWDGPSECEDSKEVEGVTRTSAGSSSCCTFVFLLFPFDLDSSLPARFLGSLDGGGADAIPAHGEGRAGAGALSLVRRLDFTPPQLPKEFQKERVLGCILCVLR